MDKDEAEMGRMKDLAARAGKAAKAAAEKTVSGTKVAGSHASRAGGAAVDKTARGSRAAGSQIARAGSAAADQAARASALAASKAQRHMPKHEQGESAISFGVDADLQATTTPGRS